MKKNKTYFTTGELARLFGVKKQTLFYYDECGIFQPDILGQNGYRYYSFTQIETFAIIRTLRSLGVSVSEIKNHMDNRSPQALIELLTAKRLEISRKIEELTRAEKYIEKKIQVTREGLNIPLGEIVLADIADEYMITTDYRGEDDEKDILAAASEHFARCESKNMYSAYPIGSIIPRSSVTADSYKYSKFYSVVDPSEIDKMDKSELVFDPGGRHLAIYDNHGYSNVHQSCLRLINYAREHGLALGDQFYEDVILDDLSTEGYYNYLVMVSIRVK